MPTGNHPPDPTLGDAVERIVVAGVAMTSVALARRTGDAGGTDLTLPQWRVLMIVGSVPGGLPLSRVAAALHVTLPATGRQLRRLAWRGLVELSPDPADRRVTRACLSAVGQELRARVLAERRSRIDAALAGVPLTGDPAADLEAVAVALESAVG